jgi:hypothetical protein
MNIYDKKQVKCSVCGKFVGEIDIQASVIFLLCEKCEKRNFQYMNTSKNVKKINQCI